jgi:hypothetical protein
MTDSLRALLLTLIETSRQKCNRLKTPVELVCYAIIPRSCRALCRRKHSPRAAVIARKINGFRRLPHAYPQGPAPIGNRFALACPARSTPSQGPCRLTGFVETASRAPSPPDRLHAHRRPRQGDCESIGKHLARVSLCLEASRRRAARTAVCARDPSWPTVLAKRQ